jgi:hypothetical protein
MIYKFTNVVDEMSSGFIILNYIKINSEEYNNFIDIMTNRLGAPVKPRGIFISSYSQLPDYLKLLTVTVDNVAYVS